MKNISLILFTILWYHFSIPLYGQENGNISKKSYKLKKGKNEKIKYGVASFYAKKFNGRKTANGEVYTHEKYTAACNVIPLNKWVKVTNLKNNRSLIVKINDRMNPKNKRLIDLSRSAAIKLGYYSRGLARVRVEVVKKKKK